MSENYFEGYKTAISDKEVIEKVEKLIKEKSTENKNEEVYKKIFSCIDLTSLNHTDSDISIQNFVNRVNSFKTNYPNMPQVAAVCVYPSMLKSVNQYLTENIKVASVAAGFPSSQTFMEVKIAETALCIMEGANEIDVVMSIGNYLSGDYQSIKEEILEIKASCQDAHLKVIIESGSLKNSEDIRKASLLAIRSGADYIKTSTGKTEPAASLEAAYVMCLTIKDFYKKTGEKVGFKAAGGIVNTEDAVNYYTIVKEVLGEEWLNNSYFRIGASRLCNNLLSSVSGKDEKYF